MQINSGLFCAPATVKNTVLHCSPIFNYCLFVLLLITFCYCSFTFIVWRCFLFVFTVPGEILTKRFLLAHLVYIYSTGGQNLLPLVHRKQIFKGGRHNITATRNTPVPSRDQHKQPPVKMGISVSTYFFLRGRIYIFNIQYKCILHKHA